MSWLRNRRIKKLTRLAIYHEEMAKYLDDTCRAAKAELDWYHLTVIADHRATAIVARAEIAQLKEQQHENA